MMPRPGAAGAPTGNAGGDLVGSTYPNPNVAAGKITLAKMANLADQRVIGNVSGAAAAPAALTGAQLATLIGAPALLFGKQTSATPFGNPGIFDLASAVPADGGWADFQQAPTNFQIRVGAQGDDSFQAYIYGSTTQSQVGVLTDGAGTEAVTMYCDAVQTLLDISASSGQTTNILRVSVEGFTAFQISATAALDLTEQADPAAPNPNIARVYARDDGAGHTQYCVRFSDGAIVILATDGATLGPVAEAAQSHYDQSANNATAQVVPAAVNVGTLVLLSDVIAAVGTLQAGINANRQLINRLIDDLQAAKLAQSA